MHNQRSCSTLFDRKSELSIRLKAENGDYKHIALQAADSINSKIAESPFLVARFGEGEAAHRLLA